MAEENPKALAAAAKERGNALFAKKNREDYKAALAAYEEAIGHTPSDPILHSNACAVYLAIAEDSWEPTKKVEALAKALRHSRQCTSLGPEWVKGYVREAQAEFELVSAVEKWKERQIQDAKWRKEEEELAEKDRKEGKEPFPTGRREEEEIDAELKTIAEGVAYSACEAACRKGLELEPANALLRTRLQSLRDVGYATDEEKDREMRKPEAAAPFKAEGNAFTAAKKWKEAIEKYSQAMAQDPFDHVFFSNRSAAYAESEEFEKAIKDADRCVALNPKFAKGYSRQAHALYHLGRYPEMEAQAKAGLAVDPENAALQEMLKQAEVETRETPEAQKHMHKLRQEKRQDARLQDLMKGLNMGGMGNGVQMFTPGAGGDLSGLLSGLQGGGGGFGGGGGGFGGFGGGGGKSRMTEEQMRGMARAMSQGGAAADVASRVSSGGYNAPAAAPAAAKAAEPEPAAPAGPAAFAPK